MSVRLRDAFTRFILHNEGTLVTLENSQRVPMLNSKANYLIHFILVQKQNLSSW